MEEEAKIKQLIEDSIKGVIQSMGLIATGALYNSINVVITPTGISIDAEDYFSSLDSKYGIMDTVEQTATFNEAMDLYTTSIANNILKNIQ